MVTVDEFNLSLIRLRWLRSQKDDESSDYDFNPNGKRKKNIAVEEW